MRALKGRPVSASRASRRIFAAKTRPNMRTLTPIYIPRGGGYL